MICGLNILGILPNSIKRTAILQFNKIARETRSRMDALTNPLHIYRVAKHDWKLNLSKRIIHCKSKITSAVFAKIIRLLIADVTTA